MRAKPSPLEPASHWAVNPEVRAFAHAYFVDVFIRANKRSQIGLLLSASLLAFLWGRSGTALWAGGWWLMVLLYTVWRFRYSAQLVNHQEEARSGKRILWMLGLSGVFMAVPLWWFDEFSEVQRAAITIVMCSTAAASVSTTAGYRLYFLAYALPMLVPLQIAWVAVHWSAGLLSAGVGLAGLILVYIAVLVSVGQQSFATFLESCRIRFGERELNQKLSAALDRESEANQAKTQFLAAASHDLRQPLHSLNVLVAALAQRPLDERSREIVKLLQTVNEALSSELDGLLEISKLDAGAVEPLLAPVSLSGLLISHAATLAPLAMERGIQLDVQASEGIFANTDMVLVHRIVSNLTSNALKFTPPGGRIRLSVTTDGHSAQLKVQDNGIGIAPEEHGRVFREFYQVSNSERDRSQGLGLGLSIVKRYCDLLGIRVDLESAPGAGTTLTLSMPVVTGMVAKPLHNESLAADGFPEGFTVLLLDDEIQIRDSMRLVFEEWGIRWRAVDTVAAAVEILHQERVDFILSDLRLRGKESGLDVAAALKAMGKSVPMALITGDTAPERIALAQQSGIPLHHKPVAVHTLLALIKSAVP